MEKSEEVCIIFGLEYGRTDGQLTHGPPETDGPPADTDRPSAGVDQLARPDGLTQMFHAEPIHQDRSITGTCMVPVLYILTDTGCVHRMVTPPVLSM